MIQKLLNIGNNIKKIKWKKFIFLKTLDYIFSLETHSYGFFLEIDKGNELTSYIIL
jgi:hypothetical protein